MALQKIAENHPNVNIRSTAKDMIFLAFSSRGSIDEKFGASNERSDERHRSSYDQAMLDLQDPLIPVRAHALITLAKMITAKDPVACSKIDGLIPIFIGKSLLTKFFITVSFLSFAFADMTI